MNPETEEIARWRRGIGGHHPERHDVARLDFMEVARETCTPPKHDLYAPDPREVIRDADGNVLNPRHCGCGRCVHGEQHVPLGAHRAGLRVVGGGES